MLFKCHYPFISFILLQKLKFTCESTFNYGFDYSVPGTMVVAGTKAMKSYSFTTSAYSLGNVKRQAPELFQCCTQEACL